MNALDMKINLKSLLRYTLPSILLMLFMSFYVMVDGVFVARYVGSEGLSAINIPYPAIMLCWSIGIMFGTGGGAICAIKLGEEKLKEAKEDFTSLVLSTLCIGIAFVSLTLLYLEEIIYLLGASEEIYQYCHDYLFVHALFFPALLFQVLFQYLLLVSGKPDRAFILTFVAGIINIILDYVFIALLGLELKGAALATGIGELFAALYGLYCFIHVKGIPLTFVKPKIRFKMLFSSMINGSSEMVSNIAAAITTYLFNTTTMRLAGIDGVAAITVILYSQFILAAIFIGYSSGVAPLLSYNFGCKNYKNIKRLFKLSLYLISVFATLVLLMAEIFAPDLVAVFVPYGTNVHSLANFGLRIFALGFLFSGINIFTSAFFTAFSNGKISAVISFMRTFVFISTALLTLPHIIGLLGVWLAVPLAEFLSFIFVVYLLKKYKAKYQY